MKKYIFSLMAVCMLGLFGSCTDDWKEETKEEGSLELSSLTIDDSEIAQIVHSAPARAAVNTDDFIISIYTPQGVSSEDMTWKYSEMPEVLRLPVGNGYTLKVKSHEIQPAEWERPFYEGSTTFGIEKNKVTRLGEILCKFNSLKVTVKFDDDLVKRMHPDSKVTVFEQSTSDVLIYTKDEKRSGYFEVPEGSTTLVAIFDGEIDGMPYTETRLFGDLKPGSHHLITFKAKQAPVPPQPTGTVEPGVALDVQVDEVSFDYKVNEDEDVIPGGDRPGQEEQPENPENPENPGEPTTPAATFTPTPANLLDGPNLVKEGMTAIVKIDCPKGFKNLVVKIDSETLTPDELEAVGLVKEFDLCNPGDLKTSLDGLLHIESGAAMVGKTEMNFDVSELVGLLQLLGKGTSNFIINVTDQTGATAGTKLVFYVN